MIILKAAEKNKHSIQGVMIQMTSDSLPETGEAEDCGTTSLKD